LVGGNVATAADNGGSILLQNGILGAFHCQWRNNTAVSGGAVYVGKFASTTFRKSAFHANVADFGGAVTLDGGVNNFYGTVFHKNKVVQEGSGVFAQGLSISIFTQAMFTNNSKLPGSADQYHAGAVVFVASADAQCTFRESGFVHNNCPANVFSNVTDEANNIDNIIAVNTASPGVDFLHFVGDSDSIHYFDKGQLPPGWIQISGTKPSVGFGSEGLELTGDSGASSFPVRFQVPVSDISSGKIVIQSSWKHTISCDDVAIALFDNLDKTVNFKFGSGPNAIRIVQNCKTPIIASTVGKLESSVKLPGTSSSGLNAFLTSHWEYNPTLRIMKYSITEGKDDWSKVGNKRIPEFLYNYGSSGAYPVGTVLYVGISADNEPGTTTVRSLRMASSIYRYGTFNCSSNPCVVPPFTGKCDDSTAHAFLCDYNYSAPCINGTVPVSVTKLNGSLPNDIYCTPWTICSSGKYVHFPGSLNRDRECKSCDPGKFSDYDNAQECTSCIAGKWSSTVGAINSTTCTSCIAGKWSSAIGASNSTECAICPAGTYTPFTGSVRCSTCPAGQYVTDKGTDPKYHLQCLLCPNGTYLESNADRLLHDSIDDCESCPAGKYQYSKPNETNGVSLASCLNCPAGTYNVDRGKNYTKHDNILDCIQCAPGKFSATEGLAVACGCLACELGTFAPSTGYAACKICGKGKFQDRTEALGCKACPNSVDVGAKECGIRVTGTPPSLPRLHFQNRNGLRLTWTHDGTGPYEVEWSLSHLFLESQMAIARTKSIAINTTRPLVEEIFRVRVRTIGGPWSLLSPAWVTAGTCDMVNEYLDTYAAIGAWRCQRCPLGAYCRGEYTTWNEVKAMFGYWRHEAGDKVSNFTRCVFPPACLGAPNPEFQGQFVNDSGVDVAMIDGPEMCAEEIGYSVRCEGDGAPRCRLCATCRDGFKRRLMDGMARCDVCPPSETNRWAIVGGFVVALGLLCGLVHVNLGSGGKRTTSEMYQVVVINYLQLSALVVGMSVPWPDVLQYIFQVQAIVSTIGEHLLSPDCELGKARPSDVLYGKQMVYVFLPWVSMGISWVFWKTVSKVRGKPWTKRNYLDPSYYDKHVATSVFLLYLIYPSLCKASVALFVSFEVDGRLFLFNDLQEPYMEGRHLHYVILLSVPQMIFAFGLPVAGFFKLRRYVRLKRLTDPSVEFRYGMLYSGYQYKRWWWDAVVALRKATVALVTSCVPADAEIHVMLCILTAAIFLHERGRPYFDDAALQQERRRKLHRFDGNALIMVYITAWTGFYFKITPNCEHNEVSCIILVTILAFANMSFFLYCIYTIWNEQVDVSKIENTLRTARNKVRRTVKRIKKRGLKRKNGGIEKASSRFKLNMGQQNPMLVDKNATKGKFINPMFRKKRTSTLGSALSLTERTVSFSHHSRSLQMTNIRLPEGWKKLRDPVAGTLLYFFASEDDSSLGYVTHEKPKVPKGWKTAFDKDTHTLYYYNKKTHESVLTFDKRRANV
jgi:hypothetical protein